MEIIIPNYLSLPHCRTQNFTIDARMAGRFVWLIGSIIRLTAMQNHGYLSLLYWELAGSNDYLHSIPFNLGIKPFFYSNQFISDYLVGFFIALALSTLPNKGSSKRVSIKAHNFRKLADLTFPLYVFHHPLLVLWKSLFNFRLNDRAQMWLAIFSSVIISLLIGIFLEKQRHFWSLLFKKLFAEIRKFASQINPGNRQTI